MVDDKKNKKDDHFFFLFNDILVRPLLCSSFESRYVIRFFFLR